MTSPKYKWKKEYSWVLLANVIYLILFYVLTKMYAA